MTDEQNKALEKLRALRDKVYVEYMQALSKIETIDDAIKIVIEGKRDD